jgi:hypothetical protein
LPDIATGELLEVDHAFPLLRANARTAVWINVFVGVSN